jgi:hypothetical protein
MASRHIPRCTPAPANPYLGCGDAIVYSVNKIADGWKISATLPESTSPSDRVKVIDWFHSYRAEVRRTNPLWLASFRIGASNNDYVLEIRPTGNLRQLAEEGEKVREILDGTLKYAQGR